MSIVFAYYNTLKQKNIKKLFTKLNFYSNLNNRAFLGVIKFGKNKFVAMAG